MAPGKLSPMSFFSPGHHTRRTPPTRARNMCAGTRWRPHGLPKNTQNSRPFKQARKTASNKVPKTATVPPQLAPSVEEAYRRKCIQLKQRTAEVEEANDAARLRQARLKRQVEKLRIERAFLLEQLAKRTSANVEDSEGSPSPPPTVCLRFCHHYNSGNLLTN